MLTDACLLSVLLISLRYEPTADTRSTMEHVGGGIRPRTLIFRCYSRPDPEQPGRWLAYCVDLALVAVGKTAEDARRSLSDAIEGYVEAVFDTEDIDSIPHLLRRGSLAQQLRWEASWLLGRLLVHGAERLYQYTPPFSLGRATA